MSNLDVHLFPCLKDNYGVLIRDPETGAVGAIDAPAADPVRAALSEKGWQLTHIFVTHHHSDHTAGIAALKAETGCRVFGPAAEEQRIPGVDIAVREPDQVTFGAYAVSVLDTPGHTIGHVSYFLPQAQVVFVGDTLFAMGCGKVLEGTAQMMWASLEKLAALPPETSVYCGHEYTLANAGFCLAIEPENEAIKVRARDVEALRAAGRPTLPTTIGLERETNVFLRPQSAVIRQRLGFRSEPDWRVFAEIRDRKNKF